MTVVFGLGNPGSLYEHTRHNAGFDAVDTVAAFFQVTLKKRCFCKYRYANVPEGILVEPLTYMNRSGNVIKHFKKLLADPSRLVVVCDNMDLAVGGLRIKLGGGSSGQKGMNSIAQALGNPDFLRIYVGTGRPAEGVAVNDHVLQKETDPVKKQAYDEALQAAAAAIEKYIAGASVQELQSEFNRKGIL